MVLRKSVVLGFFAVSFCVVLLGIFVSVYSTGIMPMQAQLEAITSLQPRISHPLAIDTMRERDYPGSDLVIEQTLGPSGNYQRYIASYQSDGLKIYGLLTVPTTQKPPQGYPVIIFNHGYIPPNVYVTTERYIAYVDTFARNGYIVFKPDYRGHGASEGKPEGAYYSPAYAVDVLNALSSLKRYKDANPQKIGMWGHSMGGNITLRDMLVNTTDIKAAIIWGGVVGSYYDLMNNWHRRTPFQPSTQEQAARQSTRQSLIAQYGTPDTNREFWDAIDPTAHLAEITAPIQIHAGDEDEEVPAAFSQSLYDKLIALGKPVELYRYPGGDHDISSPNFETAIARSVAFFDRYLK